MTKNKEVDKISLSQYLTDNKLMTVNIDDITSILEKNEEDGIDTKSLLNAYLTSNGVVGYTDEIYEIGAPKEIMVEEVEESEEKKQFNDWWKENFVDGETYKFDDNKLNIFDKNGTFVISLSLEDIKEFVPSMTQELFESESTAANTVGRGEASFGNNPSDTTDTSKGSGEFSTKKKLTESKHYIQNRNTNKFLSFTDGDQKLPIWTEKNDAISFDKDTSNLVLSLLPLDIVDVSDVVELNESEEGLIKTYADMLIYNNNGEILLLKRTSKEEIAPNQWGLAGGKVEIGETTEEAAIREAYEESGLEITNVKKLKEFVNDADSTSHYYSGLANGEPMLSEEHIEYAWVKPSDIDNYDIIFGNTDRYKELISMLDINTDLLEEKKSPEDKKKDFDDKQKKYTEQILEKKKSLSEKTDKFNEETDDEKKKSLKDSIDKIEENIKVIELKKRSDEEIYKLELELAEEPEKSLKEKIREKISLIREKKNKFINAFNDKFGEAIDKSGEVVDELLAEN